MRKSCKENQPWQLRETQPTERKHQRGPGVARHLYLRPEKSTLSRLTRARVTRASISAASSCGKGCSGAGGAGTSCDSVWGRHGVRAALLEPSTFLAYLRKATQDGAGIFPLQCDAQRPSLVVNQALSGQDISIESSNASTGGRPVSCIASI